MQMKVMFTRVHVVRVLSTKPNHQNGARALCGYFRDSFCARARSWRPIHGRRSETFQVPNVIMCVWVGGGGGFYRRFGRSVGFFRHAHARAHARALNPEHTLRPASLLTCGSLKGAKSNIRSFSRGGEEERRRKRRGGEEEEEEEEEEERGCCRLCIS